jgi:anti-sigma B factor antagonist
MSQQPQASFTVRRPSAEVGIIDIRGEITAQAEPQLMEAYAGASSDNPRVIVLNFTDLEYMNSRGIGLLVTLLIRVKRNGQRLLAYGLSDHYRQIFDVTRLAEAIQIFGSEAEALAAAGMSRVR